jgi:hypothetical protein
MKSLGQTQGFQQQQPVPPPILPRPQQTVDPFAYHREIAAGGGGGAGIDSLLKSFGPSGIQKQKARVGPR